MSKKITDEPLPVEFVVPNEMDQNEFTRIASIEGEVMNIMANLMQAKKTLWQRLAIQYDFNLETDIGSYDPKKKVIGISREVKV